jgi:hypothetical protein
MSKIKRFEPIPAVVFEFLAAKKMGTIAQGSTQRHFSAPALNTMSNQFVPSHYFSLSRKHFGLHIVNES